MTVNATGTASNTNNNSANWVDTGLKVGNAILNYKVAMEQAKSGHYPPPNVGGQVGGQMGGQIPMGGMTAEQVAILQDADQDMKGQQMFQLALRKLQARHDAVMAAARVKV